MNDVNPLLIVSDFGDEAELVPADIEDRAIADGIGVGEIAARAGQNSTIERASLFDTSLRAVVRRLDAFPKTPAGPSC